LFLYQEAETIPTQETLPATQETEIGGQPQEVVTETENAENEGVILKNGVQ
jgi:hypothetical protein